MDPIVGRNFVLWSFALAGVSMLRMGRRPVRRRDVAKASLLIVACVVPLGVASLARPVATADDRLRFSGRRLLASLAACSDVFRLESQVAEADVERAAFTLVGHHAAVYEDVFIVAFLASGVVASCG